MNGRARIACLLLAAMQSCAGSSTARMTPADPSDCAGSWAADWYDGGVDRGVGTVRIAEDGSVDGVLRDDAFNSTEWNQPVGAFLNGRLGKDGSFRGAISWSSGRAGWNLVGRLGFADDGVLRLETAPPGGAQDPGRTLTVTLHRSKM